MNEDGALMRACFGWSARAWAAPWRQFVQAHSGLHVRSALEVGADAQSSLTPLLLLLADRVECSAFDAAALPLIRARHARLLPSAARRRIHYTRQDVCHLQGCWDLIVLKSVLGGVHRRHDSTLADVRITLSSIVREHLEPGGLLVTLDNGRTALEPLLTPFGARRNGWRFFQRGDFPPADACYGFGAVSAFSAATRLGWLGRRIDDALYGLDCLLTPFTRRDAGACAVYLHVYRKPA
ncbi:MAG: hypothetical protein LBU72_08795 [Burkholderiaceae bacterium]|jgi:hypothetical protein|nr:hypothetical protein [Burkholderiaceae bacterium]